MRWNYVIMYENVKIRPVETIPGMVGRRIKENDGVNSTMIYCKNFVNVTIYPHNNNMFKKVFKNPENKTFGNVWRHFFFVTAGEITTIWYTEQGFCQTFLNSWDNCVGTPQ
jgi:hypothetical protein